VQAALILASVLALAQPFTRRPCRRDRHAMRSSSSTCRPACRRAGWIDALRAGARGRAARAYDLGQSGRRLTVIAAAQQPELVGTQLDGAHGRSLGKLEPRTPAALTAATELAATQAGANGSIDVFTDVAIDGPAQPRRARAQHRAPLAPAATTWR
jgi:hypothetical protein